MTESQKLVGRVRMEAHEERSANGQATPLQVAALDLADIHESTIAMALRLERIVHEMMKEREGT